MRSVVVLPHPDAPSSAKNELIFPDAATKAKAHEFKNLDLKTLDKYVSQFKDVTG